MASEKRLIDANALKIKLQEHHDFFVDGWRGFSKMTYATKCRVDEIDNCIAEIVNAPTVDAVEVPPVKIGDTAYFIINKKIYEAKICLIAFTQFRYTTDTEMRGEVQKNHSVSAKFSDWGKSVFATREEAEKVLYPCEYCFCGTYRSCDGCSYGERKDKER